MSVDPTLSSLVAICLVTVTSFVFTNLDNLILGVLTLGAQHRRTAPVVLGMIAASLLVLLLSIIGVFIGLAVDADLLGYLGIAPIGIGLYSLFYAGSAQPRVAQDVGAVERGSAVSIWLGTASLLFANSGDTLAILLPLLMESSRPAALVVAVTFLLCAVLWAILARVLSRQRILVRRLQDSGERFVPWIMIAVGIYILLDTGTDSLF
ncbi:MAG: cadmium resistance transporter [Halieaceae bacterium]